MNKWHLVKALKMKYIQGQSLNTLEEYEQAISNIIQIGEECKNQIEKRFTSFINHTENLNFDIDDDFLINWYKEQKKKT